MADTIFALSSGAGVAAVAVVRLSGPRAGVALQHLTGRALPEPRRLVLRRLRDMNGEIIDEALVAWLPGPASFSGEDMVEIHTHGSRAVVAAVLETLGAMPGLRPARRGEFTRRALLAGRMDLLQVEGLADLLAAETAAQRRLALRALAGDSSCTAQRWRENLVEILALAEASIDFIDEEDVAWQALSLLPQLLDALIGELAEAIDASRPAERVRDGVRVVIAGPPNAGKSSLLNWLAGREVAIVSDLPGTTRDVLQVRLDMDGIPVTVSDTAGLRTDGADAVERMGMQRARAALGEADVVIHLRAVDVEEDGELDVGGGAVVIEAINKVDLAPSATMVHDERVLAISVREGTGLDSLLQRLREEVTARFARAESALFAQARQRHALENALKALRQAREMLDSDGGWLPVELLAEHLRQAACHLDELVGRVDVEDVLDRIFQSFCIGK